ncbi:uncharacterized protein LOC120671160 isoform X1 [Panicum virgatum]|uniref:uncharacterized protein LOC120671160 isoform X1 n=1 Tax=Panicum virgatum TaxID=38727 RepID=UPI0019D6315D|nr:uncharacterized protein LOC120671160 isoform X1 [Panicum virgatum]
MRIAWPAARLSLPPASAPSARPPPPRPSLPRALQRLRGARCEIPLKIYKVRSISKKTFLAGQHFTAAAAPPFFPSSCSASARTRTSLSAPSHRRRRTRSRTDTADRPRRPWTATAKAPAGAHVLLVCCSVLQAGSHASLVAYLQLAQLHLCRC